MIVMMIVIIIIIVIVVLVVKIVIVIVVMIVILRVTQCETSGSPCQDPVLLGSNSRGGGLMLTTRGNLSRTISINILLNVNIVIIIVSIL